MIRIGVKEQQALREDFREKEREIQRYIGVYLSGLLLITGWIIGPQSKPLLEMAIGNHGYNIYAVLIVAAVNVLFTCFLVYKSLIIHDIMQFVTLTEPPGSGFHYWEAWRRSSESATRRARPIYTGLLATLPLMGSVLILGGTWALLQADPQTLVRRVSEATTAEWGSLPTADELEAVFRRASLWFWVAVSFHAFPLWFFYENVVPTSRRWKRINAVRAVGSEFQRLLDDLRSERPQETSNLVNLYDVQTGRRVAVLTTNQLDSLRNLLVEENPRDNDYHVTRSLLDEPALDPQLARILATLFTGRDELDIRWEPVEQSPAQHN